MRYFLVILGIVALMVVVALVGAVLALAPIAQAHADVLSCDRGALARAEAGMVVAQSVRWRETNPALQLVADELVRAAVDQLDAAKALCTSPSIEAAKANPWTEPVVPQSRKPNPFDGGVDPQDDAMDPDEAAWRAVMNTDPPARTQNRGGIISHVAYPAPVIDNQPRSK